jgi:hypothetical protein
MIGLYMANKTEEAFSAAETAKRREFALKRMLTTPHKPHKPIGKKKKQKTEKMNSIQTPPQTPWEQNPWSIEGDSSCRIPYGNRFRLADTTSHASASGFRWKSTSQTFSASN